MRVGTNGLVVNGLGQALLIRRDDTRTLSLPGGGLELDELPPDGAVREVEEETGLLVLPVRLVGLYYWASGSESFLIFVFRCLQRGGALATSEESLEVGFWPTNPMPRGMVGIHQQRLEDGVKHRGGRPYWVTQSLNVSDKVGRFILKWFVYPWKNWRRGAAPPPAPEWQVYAVVIMVNEANEVLWCRDEDGWRLLGGVAVEGEAPWEAAIRQAEMQVKTAVGLTNLTVVAQSPQGSGMTFVFTATMAQAIPSGADVAYYSVEQPPIDGHRQDVAYLRWHNENPTETTFHFIDGFLQ